MDIGLQELLKSVRSFSREIFEKIRGVYILLGITFITGLFLLDITANLILGLLFVDILISKWMAKSGPPGLGIETASLATIIAGLTVSPLIGGLVGALSIIFRMGVGLSGAFI